MRFILWLGIIPLWYGIKFFWKWSIVDYGNWSYLDEDYKKGWPVRLLTSIGLIMLGLWLFSGVGDFLGQRM